MDTVSLTLGVVGLALAGAGLPSRLRRRWARSRRRYDPDGLSDDLLGLQVLQHDTTEEPELDVCFVHGVTGGPRSTWTTDASNREGEIFWPRDLLAKECYKDNDFPPSRILMYGYDTEVETLGSLTEETLFHHATLLVDHLSTARVGIAAKRPLLFVAHGVGGLLVKNALASARYAGYKPSEVFANTIGIISFGVPKIETSDAPLYEMLLSLHQLSDRKGPKRRTAQRHSYRDIETAAGKEGVCTLHRRLCKYKRLAVFIPEIYIYEQPERRGEIRPIATPDRVLPKADAKNINTKSRARDIDRNFIDLPRFAARDADYKYVCAKIKTFYCGPRRANSGLLDENELYPVNGGSIRDLGYGLAPVNLPEEPRVLLDESLKNATKNIEQRLSVDRFVPLSGETELGKTTVALTYAHEKSKLPESDPSKPTCILWVNAESENSLHLSFEKIANRLREKYSGSGWSQSNENQVAPVRSVLDWLAYPRNTKWLLIFDNALEERAAYLRPYLPRGYLTTTRRPVRGQMIMTLRCSSPSTYVMPTITMEPFNMRKDQGMVEILNEDRVLDDDTTLSSGDKPAFMGADSQGEHRVVAEQPTRRYTEPLEIKPLTRRESISLFIQDLDSSNAQQPDDGLNQAGNIQRRSQRLVDAMKKDLEAVANDIAARASDKPGKVKDASNILRFALDLGKVGRELCGGLVYGEVPEEHKVWLDPCIMLAQEPIPVAVVESLLRSEDSQRSVPSGLALDCLIQVRKLAWVDISPDTTNFKIVLTERREQRRKLLRGGNDFSSDKTCAQRACNAVVDTLNRFKDDDQLEQLLVKHTTECLNHLRRWQGDLTCDWEPLADLCQKHNLTHSALEFFRAIETQGFPGPEIPHTKQGSNQASEHSYDKVEDVYVPAEEWDRKLQELSPDPTETESQVTETQNSRNIRIILKIIHLRVELGHVEDADTGCERYLRQVEDRTETRYVDLRIGLLKELVKINRMKKAWKNAIERGYQLLFLLEEQHGCTSPQAAEILHQMAHIHRSQGDYSAAIDLFEQTLISYEDRPGGPSSFLAHDVLYDLAVTHLDCGNLRKARDVCLHLRQAMRKKYGPEHSELVDVCKLLGYVYDSLGQPKESDVYFDEASFLLEEGDLGNYERRRLQGARDLANERRDRPRSMEAAMAAASAAGERTHRNNDEHAFSVVRQTIKVGEDGQRSVVQQFFVE